MITPTPTNIIWVYGRLENSSLLKYSLEIFEFRHTRIWFPFFNCQCPTSLRSGRFEYTISERYFKSRCNTRSIRPSKISVNFGRWWHRVCSLVTTFITFLIFIHFSFIQDDCFTSLDDSFLHDLFTKTSHHSSLSVILIIQFLFMKSKVGQMWDYTFFFL